MQSDRDCDREADARSAKRRAVATTQAHTSCTSAARSVAMLDTIMTSIVEFLPIPRGPYDTDVATNDAKGSEVAATWQSLQHLRLASKEFAVLLHPRRNASLWQRLLLQGFDFSIADERGFNSENHMDDCGFYENGDISEDEEENDEGDGDEDLEEAENKRKMKRARIEKTEVDPQAEAMRGRYDDMPPSYLEEDLIEWTNLGIFHRPSQYGFLTTLQQSKDGVWPESEDAFSLFGDLVRLLQLPHGDEMNAGGEGSDTMFKYIAAPTEAGSSSAFFRFYVMKTLGYVPHFWHWGSGISKEWKGFADPGALEVALTEQRKSPWFRSYRNDNDDCCSFDNHDEFEFPGCSFAHAKRLHDHIRKHCRDWRGVCCNSNSDGYTPVFFVGESKTAPYRWTGYAAEKCWT